MPCCSSKEDVQFENTLFELIHSTHVYIPFVVHLLFWKHLVHRRCHRSISTQGALVRRLELLARLFAFSMGKQTNQNRQSPYKHSQNSCWIFHPVRMVLALVRMTSQVVSTKWLTRGGYCLSANEKKTKNLENGATKKGIKHKLSTQLFQCET